MGRAATALWKDTVAGPLEQDMRALGSKGKKEGRTDEELDGNWCAVPRAHIDPPKAPLAELSVLVDDQVLEADVALDAGHAVVVQQGGGARGGGLLRHDLQRRRVGRDEDLWLLWLLRLWLLWWWVVVGLLQWGVLGLGKQWLVGLYGGGSGGRGGHGPVLRLRCHGVLWGVGLGGGEVGQEVRGGEVR